MPSHETFILSSPPPLIEHPAAVYISQLAPGSKRAMTDALDKIAKLLTNGEGNYLTLDWAKLKYRHTAAIRAALLQNYEAATVNRMLSALRRVLREALRLELMTPQDYARAVDIQNIKVSRELRGRALSQEEIGNLFKVCFLDKTPAGYRDAALLAVLSGAGLRRAEAVGLKVKDFNSSDGQIKIRGKGNVDRTVYVPENGVGLVKLWLEIKLNSSANSPIFVQIARSGRVIEKELTPQAILFILKKRGEEAHIPHFSPHDMRRTYVSELLDAGIDLVTVQNLAGHSNPAITARYDRRGEDRKKRAAATLNIPIMF